MRDSDLFQSLADLSGYIFRIQDNGGESADRYTVAFSDGDCLALSGAPSHPQGVSMWGELTDVQWMNEAAESGRAIDLALGDLPEHIQRHIMGRCNAAWRDFLESPDAVAPSRDQAEANEGIHNSGGKGVYAAGSAYCVRLDGPNAAEDRGPFLTVREAILATLPDEYGLAGPEYHSPLDPASLNPTTGVAEAIAALEARVQSAWESANA